MAIEVTDEYRRLFDSLTDTQIAAVLARTQERVEKLDEHEPEHTLARILRAFGYKGLEDYLKMKFGRGIEPEDFEDIAYEWEKLNYADLASIRATIVGVQQAQTDKAAAGFEAMLNDIRKPLEDDDG